MLKVSVFAYGSLNFCLINLQGNLQVASVYAGSDSVQLKGSRIIEELNYYLKLLTLCYLFSKKPFPVFLESGGFSLEDVLLQKPKAAVRKLLTPCICLCTYIVLLLNQIDLHA